MQISIRSWNRIQEVYSWSWNWIFEDYSCFVSIGRPFCRSVLEILDLLTFQWLVRKISWSWDDWGVQKHCSVMIKELISEFESWSKGWEYAGLYSLFQYCGGGWIRANSGDRMSREQKHCCWYFILKCKLTELQNFRTLLQYGEASFALLCHCLFCFRLSPSENINTYYIGTLSTVTSTQPWSKYWNCDPNSV